MSLHGFLDAVDYNPPQKTNDHLPEAICNLAGEVIRLRDEPDHGVWELPGETHQVLHSKGMHRVALECAIAIGTRIGHPDAETLAHWQAVSDDILRDYLDRGWNEARGAYTMWYGSDVLDASLLRLVLYEAFEAHDPRISATLERIEAELGDGDLLYRYRFDDGLEGTEATFSACSFWRVGVLALMGRTREGDRPVRTPDRPRQRSRPVRRRDRRRHRRTARQFPGRPSPTWRSSTTRSG